jgi:hypothetical protein
MKEKHRAGEPEKKKRKDGSLNKDHTLKCRKHNREL